MKGSFSYPHLISIISIGGNSISAEKLDVILDLRITEILNNFQTDVTKSTSTEPHIKRIIEHLKINSEKATQLYKIFLTKQKESSQQIDVNGVEFLSRIEEIYRRQLSLELEFLSFMFLAFDDRHEVYESVMEKYKQKLVDNEKLVKQGLLQKLQMALEKRNMPMINSIFSVIFASCYRLYSLQMDQVMELARLYTKYYSVFGNMQVSIWFCLCFIEALSLEIVTEYEKVLDFKNSESLFSSVEEMINVENFIMTIDDVSGAFVKGILLFTWSCYLSKLATVFETMTMEDDTGNNISDIKIFLSRSIHRVVSYRVFIAKSFQKFNVLQSLKSILTSPLCSVKEHSSSLACKSVIKGLFILFLDTFQIDLIPGLYDFIECFIELFKDSGNISLSFLEIDLLIPARSFILNYLSYHHSNLILYIRILSSLCNNKRCAHYVSQLFSSIKVYSKVNPAAVEVLYKNNIVLKADDKSNWIDIPLQSTGCIIGKDKGDLLIAWDLEYDGFSYFDTYLNSEMPINLIKEYLLLLEKLCYHSGPLPDISTFVEKVFRLQVKELLPSLLRVMKYICLPCKDFSWLNGIKEIDDYPVTCEALAYIEALYEKDPAGFTPLDSVLLKFIMDVFSAFRNARYASLNQKFLIGSRIFKLFYNFVVNQHEIVFYLIQHLHPFFMFTDCIGLMTTLDENNMDKDVFDCQVLVLWNLKCLKAILTKMPELRNDVSVHLSQKNSLAKTAEYLSLLYDQRLMITFVEIMTLLNIGPRLDNSTMKLLLNTMVQEDKDQDLTVALCQFFTYFVETDVEVFIENMATFADFLCKSLKEHSKAPITSAFAARLFYNVIRIEAVRKLLRKREGFLTAAHVDSVCCQVFEQISQETTNENILITHKLFLASYLMRCLIEYRDYELSSTCFNWLIKILDRTLAFFSSRVEMKVSDLSYLRNDSKLAIYGSSYYSLSELYSAANLYLSFEDAYVTNIRAIGILISDQSRKMKVKIDEKVFKTLTGKENTSKLPQFIKLEIIEHLLLPILCFYKGDIEDVSLEACLDFLPVKTHLSNQVIILTVKRMKHKPMTILQNLYIKLTESVCNYLRDDNETDVKLVLKAIEAISPYLKTQSIEFYSILLSYDLKPLTLKFLAGQSRLPTIVDYLIGLHCYDKFLSIYSKMTLSNFKEVVRIMTRIVFYRGQHVNILESTFKVLIVYGSFVNDLFNSDIELITSLFAVLAQFYDIFKGEFKSISTIFVSKMLSALPKILAREPINLKFIEQALYCLVVYEQNELLLLRTLKREGAISFGYIIQLASKITSISTIEMILTFLIRQFKYAVQSDSVVKQKIGSELLILTEHCISKFGNSQFLAFCDKSLRNLIQNE